MPVGVIMVWRTPRTHRLFLRQKYHVLPAFNARNRKVWFLIDGQQRVSVIHRVCEGDAVKNARGKEIDFGRVVLSLEREEDGQQIRYRRPLQGSYERMSDVLHPNWRTRLSHLGKRQRESVGQTRTRILKYPIPLMFVEAKIAGIRETFLRINTQGMKITTADAIFTRAENLDLRDFRHEVRQHVHASFGVIDEMPILFAMAVANGGTEARGRALEMAIMWLQDTVGNDRVKRSRLTKDLNRLGVCFGKAVDHLRQNFRVLSEEYLYSDYMLAMLALFFY